MKKVHKDFKSLSIAAMRLSGELLMSLSEAQALGVEKAMKAGSRLMLEFGPLPEFKAVTLFLVEVEGTRHRLGSFDIAEDERK